MDGRGEEFCVCGEKGKRGREVGKLGFKGFGFQEMRLLFIHQTICFFEMALNIWTLGCRVQGLKVCGKRFMV